jgi:hypothetical protein
VKRAAALAAAAVLAAGVRAQDPPDPGPAQRPARLLQDFDGALAKVQQRDDYREAHVTGGFRYEVPHLELTIRGTNALLLTDLDEGNALLSRDGRTLRADGFPLPAPRRRLDADELRARLARTLQPVGRAGAPSPAVVSDAALDVPRYLYCEGGVVVVRSGVEVLRCDRLSLSLPDDRIVVENAELRYTTPTATGADTLVVRAPKLVKQGARWTGRDVLVTTCSAGVPHYGMALGEVEIVERDREFELIARGQRLQLGGTNIVPLPDAHVFTGSQSQFPIRRVRGSYSQKEGAQAEVVLGLPWNDTGGALHHWLTGRPPHEFRGDWELGVGWIEKRGEPLDGVLEYRAPGLYEGRTEGFWIDDRGDDLREIRTNLDGSDIGPGHRGVVRTQNRVHLGPRTHFDAVAWYGSDAAVWSEYFRAPYRVEEVPETSTYLHHADRNRLLTVGTRFNLSEFSYRDDRALAERFVEELPVATYQWLAQPIATTPWHTPIVVDLETEIGQRRSDYDDRAGFRVGDRTARADQLAEVSAPFALAGWNVRPFVSARGTFFDGTVDGGSEARIAWTGGVQLGTRWSRTWAWLEDGESQGVRHVIAPRVSLRNRFHVDDRAAEFFAFDAVDTLGEEQLVRVEVRNLLQSMVTTAHGREPHDFVFLDLAQDVFPDAGRDNGGDTLGLFYYDLLLRPTLPGAPFDRFAFALYGDHDWEDGLRTLDTELQFGPVAGIDWTLEYRTDTNVDGAVGVNASTSLLQRWDLFAASQRDLDRDRWLSYVFGLRRNDHDWSIAASVVYNPFSDETTFRLEFVPRLGSFSSPRGSRFDDFDSPASFATAY